MSEPDPYAALNANQAKPIDEMFVVASDLPGGGEGVVAFLDCTGAWMPMVGADAQRIAAMVKIARRIYPGPFKVLRFTGREDVTANYAPGKMN